MVNFKPKNKVRLKIAAASTSHAHANVSVRDIEFAIDEPIERGGTNLGPSPTESAVAALLGCTNVIGHKCAKKLDIDIGNLTIDAVYELDRRGVLLQEEIDLPFTKITLDIVVDGPATEEQLQQVASETAKFCAVSKMFKASGTIIEEKWSKKIS